MSKEYHKYLVGLIQKYAKKPPPTPPGYTPEAAKPAVAPTTTPGARPTTPKPGQPAQATPVHTSVAPAKSPNIVKLQESLIALAKNVNSQIRAEDVAKIDTDDKGQTTVTPEAREAAGRNSFMDFVTKNFARESDVPGVEFDPNANKTKMDEKQPTEVTRMTSVMNTMSRIGGAANEIIPDGKWGPRTNAALHNAYAFAFSMLKLASAFKTPLKAYSDKDLEEFKKNLPAEDAEMSSQQKHEFAPAFTQHINAISNMFNEIKRNILNNPKHQAYIETNQPFVSYKKVVPLTQQEIAWQKSWSRERRPENYFNISLDQPGVSGSKLVSKINFTDLVSAKSFDAWYNGPEGKELQQPGVTKPLVLAAIKKALQTNVPSAPSERPA